MANKGSFGEQQQTLCVVVVVVVILHDCAVKVRSQGATTTGTLVSVGMFTWCDSENDFILGWHQ